VRGSFLTTLEESYSAWTYHKINVNIIETLFESAKYVIVAATPDVALDTIVIVNFILPLVGLGLVFAGSIYLIVNKEIPLGVFGLVSIVFYAINSNLVSVHRYLLPVLCIYIAIALFASKKYPVRRFIL